METYRNDERGSITTFVVVGVIVTIVALGVLYGLGKLGRTNDTAPPLIYNQSENQKKDSASGTSTEDKKSDTSSTTTDGTPDATKGGSVSRESRSPQTSSDGSQASNSTSATQPLRDDSLPQTGLADSVAAGVALAVLISALVAYRRSQSFL